MNITKGLKILCTSLQDMWLIRSSQKLAFIGTTNRNPNFMLCRNISQAKNEVTPFNSDIKIDTPKKEKISKAMKAYLQRSVEHENFMSNKITEYEIGKRHLANMMGEDPETFTQNDIDEAITYLLPSGLFEPRARPVMKHPLELFPKQREAEFDESGRPFHSLFYTGKPVFFSILQQVALKAKKLNEMERTGDESTSRKLDIKGSRFISKNKLEEMILEKVSDNLFQHFILSFERLIEHPLSSLEEEFIMKYRDPIPVIQYGGNIDELMYTENGIPYMTASGLRKLAKSEVTIYGQGSGKFVVNGKDILYFESIQDREQVLFPLQFSGMLGSVDVEGTVEGGGSSGQAGALRYAISVALKSFVSPTMAEKMRIG